MIIYLKQNKKPKAHSYSDLLDWMEVLPDLCHWEKTVFFP